MEKKEPYRVRLDQFEGPLDLLLHLIHKNKVDIYDIPIAEITQQYLGFLETARQMDLEVASEFLLLAATLIQIKVKMLLPKRQQAEEAMEVDPREELVQRLLEYQFFKESALVLQEQEQHEAEFMLKQVDLGQMAKNLSSGNPVEGINLDWLLVALRQLLQPVPPTKEKEITLQKDHYPIEEILMDLRCKLRTESALEFRTLFQKGDSRQKIVTTFLALLELCRTQEITIQQQGNFEAVWIFSVTAQL